MVLYLSDISVRDIYPACCTVPRGHQKARRRAHLRALDTAFGYSNRAASAHRLATRHRTTSTPHEPTRSPVYLASKNPTHRRVVRGGSGRSAVLLIQWQRNSAHRGRKHLKQLEARFSIQCAHQRAAGCLRSEPSFIRTVTVGLGFSPNLLTLPPVRQQVAQRWLQHRKVLAGFCCPSLARGGHSYRRSGIALWLTLP